MKDLTKTIREMIESNEDAIPLEFALETIKDLEFRFQAILKMTDKKAKDRLGFLNSEYRLRNHQREDSMDIIKAKGTIKNLLPVLKDLKKTLSK